MRWNRRRSDDDFRREIEAHLAIETDRLVGEGLSPEEARHAAARRFGNGTAARERFYESRRILWFDELRSDVRYARRALRRSPGFSTVAILTLALGIGANTAIFSVVNAALLRPLPYRDPGSLVLIETSPLVLAAPWLTAAWREHARTIRDFAGFNGPRSATLIADGDPVSVDSAMVTWNFLAFLGVSPAIGRDFTEGDGTAPLTPVALISDGLFVTRFGGDPAVLGKPITVGGAAVTIVGVTPRKFRFPAAGALPANALPTDTQPDVLLVAPPGSGVNVIARLAPGVTIEASAQELLGLFKQAATSQFGQSLADRLELRTGLLQDRLAGDMRQRIWLALGAVGFVLLVACANVANLLLARASSRHRELAVRAALGARKGRLVRLLLTESLVLACLGSAGGLALAFWTRSVARTVLADRLPHVEIIALDSWVLAFTAAVAAATGVACGLVSISGATRANVASVFNGGGTSTASGRTIIGRALLSSQIAVTFVLVVGAALLVQTFWNLMVKDRGFDPHQLLTVRVSAGLPSNLDRTDPSAGPKYFAEFFTVLTQRMAAMPSVSSAAAVSSVPFAGLGAGMGSVVVDGQPPLAAEDGLAMVAAVTPGYFYTMRIPLVAGRDFDERDRFGSEKVVIVNSAFRHRFAARGDIVGAQLKSGTNVMTIVGVVGDVPDRSLRDAPEPLVFLALRQMAMHPFGWGQLRMVLRAREGDPSRLASAVREEVWSADPTLVIDELATMDQRVSATLRSERDSALLFGLFALAAVVMAAIGVYGVAAYAIAQRTKEIGIRVALGAAAPEVRRLVLSQTLWPATMGVAIGISAAVPMTRLVASMVYGVGPFDPATFTGAALVLVVVALLATWMPARRATRIDPLVALRDE